MWEQISLQVCNYSLKRFFQEHSERIQQLLFSTFAAVLPHSSYVTASKRLAVRRGHKFPKISPLKRTRMDKDHKLERPSGGRLCLYTHARLHFRYQFIALIRWFNDKWQGNGSCFDITSYDARKLLWVRLYKTNFFIQII